MYIADGCRCRILPKKWPCVPVEPWHPLVFSRQRRNHSPRDEAHDTAGPPKQSDVVESVLSLAPPASGLYFVQADAGGVRPSGRPGPC